MVDTRISLKEAIKFHGHLGPYLVLGILAGEMALNKLGCKKYFGLEVKAWGANKKPKSCLIDGIQLSSGATYGKGNICKMDSRNISLSFINLKTNKKLSLCLDKKVTKKLNGLKNHNDSEDFARKLYNTDPRKIYNISITN